MITTKIELLIPSNVPFPEGIADQYDPEIMMLEMHVLQAKERLKELDAQLHRENRIKELLAELNALNVACENHEIRKVLSQKLNGNDA